MAAPVPVAAAAVVHAAAVAADVAAAAVVAKVNRISHTDASMNMKSTNPSTAGALRSIVLALLLAVPLAGQAQDQKTFATPEAAVDALIAALKVNDEPALLGLVGSQYKRLVSSGDAQSDATTRAALAANLQTFRALDDSKPDRRVLLVGTQAWPLPIPLVKQGDAWRFATEQGDDEILNRRIGFNERQAISVLRAYLGAQKAYAQEDRNGDGVLQYAQKLGSSPGKKDGLYWPADSAKGEEMSPFGPLVAESAAYLGGKKGSPFHGYHFRILTRQGKGAPGGAYNYLVNGRMIAGFAMVAYPAVYGDSGVMTFVVSHNGKVYEKDLGKNSGTLALAMTTFDPGVGWKETDAPQLIHLKKRKTMKFTLLATAALAALIATPVFAQSKDNTQAGRRLDAGPGQRHPRALRGRHRDRSRRGQGHRDAQGAPRATCIPLKVGPDVRNLRPGEGRRQGHRQVPGERCR